MKFNKYFFATSVLVLNALVAPSAAIAQDTQTSSTSESSEKVTNQSPLFDENSLPNQEVQSSSEQSTTSTEQTESSESSNQEESSTEEVTNNFSEETTTSSSSSSIGETTTKKEESSSEVESRDLSEWEYTKKNNYYLLTKYKGGNDVVVPSEINGLPVKLKTINGHEPAAGESVVFPNYKSITSIKILPSKNGTKVGLEKQDLTSAFNMWSSLKTADLTGLDVSNVTNMYNMFADCGNLTSLNVSGWNTSRVTSMGFMFNLCYKLTNLDLSSWNTSNLTYTRAMFQSCENLTNVNMSNWTTDNITDMGYMFNNCYNLTNLDLSKWNTSNVTDMSYMFSETRKLKFLDLKNLNLNKVTATKGMFGTEVSVPLLVYANDSKLLTYDYSKDNRVPVGPALDANGGKFKDNSSVKYYIEKVAYKSNSELSPKLNLASFESYKKEHIPTKENEVFSSWELTEGTEPITNIALLNPIKYAATYKLLSVNIPSQDVDNTKPEKESVYGIAYMPKQFQIPKTELNDSGNQTIEFDKADRFDVGVRDYRKEASGWVLKAQLNWTPGKELSGAYIKTTNNAGTVMKNNNNGTDSFNPNTDLTPSNNEVIGMKNVTITSDQSAPIMKANNVAHNAVYNYNLGKVSLEIPDTQSIEPGVYEGFVEWNLSDTLV